jgi:hypothetical protein
MGASKALELNGDYIAPGYIMHARIFVVLSLEQWDRRFDSYSRHRCMPAFYATLLAGTTGRHPIKAVQPNVYTKIPNPENGEALGSVRLQLQRYRCEKEHLTYSIESRSCCGGRLPCTQEALFHCKAKQWLTGAILEFVMVAKNYLFFVFLSHDTIRKLIITLCAGDIKTGNLIAKFQEVLRHTDFLHAFPINTPRLHKLSSVKVLHL